jgi:hypothetical protein
MSSNVGNLDRIVRFTIAAGLLYAGLNLYQGSTVGIGLDIAAGLLTFSAAFGFCGLYRLLGINTKSQN